MSANDRQVGGNHYQLPNDDLQHWDVVAKFDLDYFQGQITKYLMRWKHKHSDPKKKLEDLKKAQHFLEKYIEVEAAKVHLPARDAIRDGWIGKPGAFVCFKCGTQVSASTIEEAEQIHGHCATGRGYVDQG